MLLAFFGIILGALTGAVIAWRRKGKLADILQYAAVFALIFGISGLFLALIIARTLG